MKKLKVVKVGEFHLEFENEVVLGSDHDQDCCENHYLSFKDLTLRDFEGLEFDLEGNFFNRIAGYGIELVPVQGFSVKVPGYGSNNGYYSSNLSLYVVGKGFSRSFEISECQDIDG